MGVGYYLDYRNNPIEFYESIKSIIQFLLVEFILWFTLDFLLGVRAIFTAAVLLLLLILYIAAKIKKPFG
jgi:hypothetical protein